MTNENQFGTPGRDWNLKQVLTEVGWLKAAARVSGAAGRVAIDIYSRALQKGAAFSQENEGRLFVYSATLAAKRLLLSPSSVKRALSELKTCSFITTKKRIGRECLVAMNRAVKMPLRSIRLWDRSARISKFFENQTSGGKKTKAPDWGGE